MSTSLAVARAVDLLVHDDLDDPFCLAQARLYISTTEDPSACLAVLDEDENPYRLLMRTRHHQPIRAGCLVVTGWCAPMTEGEQTSTPGTLRPSEHPERRRVRVSVAITDEGIASVMRQSDDPLLVREMPDRGVGDLPDVLESWWLGNLQ